MGAARNGGGPRVVIDEAQPLIERARKAGYTLLPESDGFELLKQLGLSTPISTVFRDPQDLKAEVLEQFPGEQVVLKANCADLAHKTEVGGVRVLPRDLNEVRLAASRMALALTDRHHRGYLLQEYVDVRAALGEELLLSLCWDREFGPVVTFGSGGTHTEILARYLAPEVALAVGSVELLDHGKLVECLNPLLATGLLTQSHRGQSAKLPVAALGEKIERWARLAAPLMEVEIQEIEINPLVVRRGELVALDVLVRLADQRPTPSAVRPTNKLRCLLEPRSIGIVGVSKELNPGHVILDNILREGFDPSRIWVIKPGVTALAGCRCVDSLERLSEPVDLLIVAVSASQVPELLRTVVNRRLAESVIVIPGGLEEKEGGEAATGRLLGALQRARESEWGGPVINGGNCMGIRSAPGRYDTFFLPDYKLPPAGEPGARAALLAQSGAFIAAKISKLASISFKYSISIGNQLDLTLGDYLEYLARDLELQVVAAYVEGFKTLDGLRFIEAAKTIREEGRTVVLYRAGRSAAGIEAAASHTASVAGSYLRTAALSRAAGVLVADTLSDFEDLVTLAVRLAGRRPLRRRLAGVSNAGFECVVLSDHLRWFLPAEFTPHTRSCLRSLLERGGAAELVDVRNPLDLTPMMGDELFSRAVETVLSDPNVEVGVIGCVPLTGTLNTLQASSAHHEDIDQAESIASRLIGLWQRTEKPWVVVIDAGRPYDPLADSLVQAGVPVFRHMDRAVRILEIFARYQDSSPATVGKSMAQG